MRYLGLDLSKVLEVIFLFGNLADLHQLLAVKKGARSLRMESEEFSRFNERVVRRSDVSRTPPVFLRTVSEDG